MTDDQGVLKRIRYLGLAIERGTDSVPDDGRYYITHDCKVVQSCGSLTIAEAYLEIEAQRVQEERPELQNPRDLIRKERSFNDILAVRGQSRAAAREKQSKRGGKGGRGGV
ncbi:hypothetical protein FCG67_19695 [Rhodococcus oryzae]|uniref:Uncharacterized protein n=1 Tax=Rhodococcus oryzae TaxID=2571143 RepID=A0ABY2RG39_9NOCA|nr:hypothetical protein [Rhodococcus oryzae]TJZ75813.1 hypothetical protein FCG67_19695 [Rhodococcus oryzae]